MSYSYIGNIIKGEIKPAILPNAKVEPIPKDLYNVEYDSNIKGTSASAVSLIKNLKNSNPVIRNYSLQNQIENREIEVHILPVNAIRDLPHLSM